MKPHMAEFMGAIDLDLVVLNGNVLRPTDFSAPYFKKGLSHLIDVS